MKYHNLSYRPDIDGLRAIAIISVICFHAFPSMLTGGFVGVDVFFVISGFLISGIIFQKTESQSFTYSDFYYRRIKRIFPALSLMLIVSVVVGWFITIPDEFEKLGLHVLAGAGFVSNIALWRESGYFDTVAETKPLLHLWSLGVEEQFYIFWPILVSLFWKKVHNFLFLIVPLAILSFLIGLWLLDVNPSGAFYLPFGRGWELMVGSILAYLNLHRPSWLSRLIDIGFSNVISLIGVTLLLISFTLIDKGYSFPGWWALLPVFGSFSLILAGKDAWLNKFVLGNRIFVYIGLISYPLYLWHWPVLVFGRLAGMTETVANISLLVFLSFALAACTYHFVEAPIGSAKKSLKRIAESLSWVMVFVVFFGLVIWSGLQPMHSSVLIKKVASASGDWDYPGRLVASSFSGHKFRSQGVTSDKKILFFGDSNIEQYYPRAEVVLHNRGDAQLVFATTGGCPPIPGVFEAKHPNCNGFVDAVMKYSRDTNVKTIVIGSQWAGYFSGKGNYFFNSNGIRIPLGPEGAGNREAMRSLQGMVSDMINSGKKVYLVGGIPVGIENDPRSMILRSVYASSFLSIQSNPIKKGNFMAEYAETDLSLRKIARETGAVFISPIEFLCGETECPTVFNDGLPIYKDSSHLRPSFVRDKADFIDIVFQ